jgi:23S rRNA pseudouridine2605 synthase
MSQDKDERESGAGPETGGIPAARKRPRRRKRRPEGAAAVAGGALRPAAEGQQATGVPPRAGGSKPWKGRSKGSGGAATGRPGRPGGAQGGGAVVPRAKGAGSPRSLPRDEHGDINGNAAHYEPAVEARPARPPRGGSTFGRRPIAAEGAAGAAGAAAPGIGGRRPHRQGGEAAGVPPAREGGRSGRGARGVARHGESVRDAEPVRLHKILAQAGFGSRRELEDWILAGRISVNGKPAEVGQVVGPKDRIKLNGRLINVNFSERLPRVLIYNKPEGEIVSRDDPEGRPSVFEALPRINGGRWIAVGRLDFNSSGLLVFTTSGELANRLMHPRYEIIREYAVRVLGDLDEEAKHELVDGVMLEDGPARFHLLEEAGGEGANRWYRVILHEGRNREVRRMFELVGATVSRLMRVRYGPLSLPPNLRRGKVAELDERNVVALLEAVGMSPPRPRFVR